MDMDFLSRTRQRSPDAWGTSQPHNMFDELTIPEKIVMKLKTRQDAGLLTKDSVYHPSFLVSPIQIKPDPANMVTLDTLKKKFGANWQPTCSELNATEKQYKVTWGGPSRKVCRSRRSIIAETLTLNRLGSCGCAGLHRTCPSPFRYSQRSLWLISILRTKSFCLSQFIVLYLCVAQYIHGCCVSYSFPRTQTSCSEEILYAALVFVYHQRHLQRSNRLAECSPTTTWRKTLWRGHR